MPQFDREKWDAKYSSPDGVASEPSHVITELDASIPRQGKAIDVAGGAGRHAIWLAQRGLDVTLADISSAGLAIAAERAAAARVAITTLQVDLEAQPFPHGPWDLILTHHYLWRPLFPVFARELAVGGVLVVVQPMVTNLERHEKPPRPYLLEDDELPGLVSDLDTLHYQEGWLNEGRHEAVLVARRRNTK